MSKHSVGPWRIAPMAGKYYGTAVVLGDGTEITVWTPDHYADPFASDRELDAGWTPEDGHDHVEDVRSLANARLIAAAPAMLEALQRCHIWLQGTEPGRARYVGEVIAKADP